MENYVGKRLDGRYEIMEIIGVGGMAVVYKAYDNIDGKIVAVKILKDEFLANEEFKRRFKNESKAIAVLSHPNIVKIFDVSYGDMLQYIVMEYVEGITLKEYMQQQVRVDPREAIYFVTQILRALQHAHDKGIVHRDVKPQNIMLQADGTIKVTDFGIARFSRGETKTMTDCAIGSVHYISPEQAKGNVTDAKTDLYAVGVIIYEMLTGSLPFQSDNAVSVALMQLQKDPIMPRDINPNIPIGLEQIIMRAMQKNITDRYQSASEILFDLDRYKKNPNIKFDYNFSSTASFEDTERESAAMNRNAQTQRPRPPMKKEPVQMPQSKKKQEDYDDYVDDKTKKRTIGILTGVLIAIIAFAVAVFGLFSDGKNTGVEVPDLIGLNFYKDVVNNSDYINFEIVPQFKEDSLEENGKIIDQIPEANEKVEIGSKITVYIAGSASEIPVPDVTGKQFSIAENELKSAGFKVTIVKEKDESVEVGSVLRTSPAKGENATPGSTVTMYVATNVDVEPVDVPNLMGLTLSEAKAALEEVGLILDVDKSEYRQSLRTKGTIIGYEKIGEQVMPGTKISVYISTGTVTQESDTSDTTETTDTSKTTTKKPTTTERKTTLPPTETTVTPTTPITPTEPINPTDQTNSTGTTLPVTPSTDPISETDASAQVQIDE